MEIPRFKPSKKFVDDIEVPCLVAKGKNSQLPGVAVAYRAEFKKDPEFTVFVRGGEKMTEWQQQVLDRLFTHDGLSRAIEAGLTSYQASPAFSEEDLDEEVKRDGLRAHVYLNKIILDEPR